MCAYAIVLRLHAISSGYGSSLFLEINKHVHVHQQPSQTPPKHMARINFPPAHPLTLAAGCARKRSWLVRPFSSRPPFRQSSL